MKVVIIDNYDSFTYNLAHLVKELGADPKSGICQSLCACPTRRK